MSHPSVINFEAIDNLRALSPDDGDSFLREIVQIFIEDTPKRIAELHACLASGEAASFVRAAHSIKGSASNLGAVQLRSVAERLEHHARQSGVAGVEADLAVLESAFADAKSELQKI